MNFFEVFFLILSALSEFLIVLTLLRTFLSRNFLEKDELPKIGTAFLLYLLIIFIFLHAHGTYYWVFSVLPLGFLFFAEKILLIRQEQQLREKFPVYLDQIILRMKSGQALRTALQSNFSSGSRYFDKKIEKLLDSVVFSQHKINGDETAFFANVVRIFQTADRSPHQALQQLVEFRRQMRMTLRFRQKSKQVTLQIRAQALTLAFMFCVVVGLSIHCFGFAKNQMSILLGIFLYLAGFFWIYCVARGWQWKI